LSAYNISLDLDSLSFEGLDYVGMRNLGRGGLLESIFLVAIMIYLIDRQFVRACVWSLLAAPLALFGFINSEKLGFLVHSGDSGYRFAIAFLLLAAFFVSLHFLQSRKYVDGPFEEEKNPQSNNDGLEKQFDQVA